MDINLNYSEDDNPVALKADFILSLCELIMGSKDGLQPIEKTVIDRCVHQIYQRYFDNPAPENMPILEDLYDALLKQDEKEAHHVATALEIYVKGSLKLFNNRTNVDIQNRLVCFDIKELGNQLKKIGMLIVQDQVWGRVTANRSAGKSTRYYIDEFHLLLKEEQTATYSVEIWKRFRKWGGLPTGITQNVKDLLRSPEIANILENSDFIYMLNQASSTLRSVSRSWKNWHRPQKKLRLPVPLPNAKSLNDKEDTDMKNEKWDDVHGNTTPDDRMVAFLESPTDSYAILQLREDVDDNIPLMFANYSYLQKKEMEPEIDRYEVVYHGSISMSEDVNRQLEDLYVKFNIDHPDDFRGHSMSVSDIVALKVVGEVSFHYVDSVGFQKLENFMKSENYLKNAEMAMEDDYGMIDGIINNGKASGLEERPVEHATLPKEEHKTRDIWTAEVLQKALEACDDDILRLAINLAFSCSLRMGELLGLTWDCIDISPTSIELGQASIFVEKELQRVNREAMADLDGKDIMFKFPPTFASTHTALVLKTPKTKTSVRKVFLPKTVAEMLVQRKADIEELKDLFGDEFVDFNLVFCSSNGKPIEGQVINRAFNKLIEEKGLPKVVFHSLRHSSITYKLKLNGGDMKSVQGDSGHAQVKMVADVYSHIIDDDRRLNAERMEAAFYSGRQATPEPVQPAATESSADDKELLLKLLQNPEMAALLKSLAKTL